MNITFQYTPTTLQAAHELHYKRFFRFQSRLPIFLGMLAVWSGLLLFLILGKEGNKFLSISLMVTGAGAMLAYYIIMRTLGKRVYNRLSAYHDPFVIEIEENHIRMNIKDSHLKIPWAEIKKAVISPEIVLLYPTDRMFYIFPKSNFQENEFDYFKKLVSEKVPSVF
ncbi:MAG: YcxB family protein [Chitinophagales bacterium]|jgi:hypothetical protein|nr:YcxB family protein [Chitinophagales bacterium]